MNTIDAHVYIGENLFGLDQSPESLIHLMDASGVDQAVLIPSKPKRYAFEPANQMVAEMVKDHPDRFAGMVRVDPWQKQAALDELRRAHQQLGLFGLVLHPWEELFQISDHLLDPLIEYAIDQDMPVMVEMGYPLLAHPLDLAELANGHPRAKFIGTHGLQLDGAAFALTDSEVAMRECPNIIMETSGMYAPELMETLVRDLGVERLVYGSHSPWLDMRLEVERARLLRLTPEQKDLVMGGNIRKLLKR